MAYKFEAPADHCPFLNRRDCRCGEHLSLQGLGQAFEHCFGQYKSCPVYFDQLVERRARRAEAAEMAQHAGQQQHQPQRVFQVTINRPLVRAIETQTPAGAPPHANAA